MRASLETGGSTGKNSRSTAGDGNQLFALLGFTVGPLSPERPSAPRESKFERRAFELLRQAYVNARYSPHFKISEDELTWLTERTARLQQLVERVCRERLSIVGSS